MEPAYRILGVDPGTRRVGLALSDDMHYTARALAVRPRSRVIEEDMDYLRELVEAHEVGEIVCGMPYRLDGSASDSTDRARVYFEAIVQAFPELPVKERDEALTTWEAEAQMKAEGLSPKARRAQVDAYAARVLLQEELDERQTQRRAAAPDDLLD